ncbi:MAG: hypothetical protein FWE85_05085, partial [Clostridiales bacterium]|nr:hypothetical protein [Clostridiales bacterium]
FASHSVLSLLPSVLRRGEKKKKPLLYQAEAAITFAFLEKARAWLDPAFLPTGKQTPYSIISSSCRNHAVRENVVFPKRKPSRSHRTPILCRLTGLS